MALVLALVTLLPASSALAATSGPAADKRKRQQQIGRQIDDLKDQVEDLSAEEAGLSDQLDASSAQLADLDAQVHDLDVKVTAAEDVLRSAQRHLDAVQGELRDAQNRVQTVEGELAAARDELRRRAVDTYVAQDREQLTNLVLGLKSQRDIDAAAGYAATLVGAQRGAVDRYDALRDEADRARQAVVAARDEAVHQRDVVAGQTDAVRADRAALDAVRQQAAVETAHQKDLLNQVQGRKATFESQISNLQAESDSITKFLQTLPAGAGGIVITGRGVFSIPVPGARIVSGFGVRIHPIYHTARMHTGLDFAASSGTPIHAAADGTVVMAGTYGGYGNATIIDHGNGVATLYGHQSRILVGQGQHVVRGETIGLVGSTGFSTGPHLHFEVRLGGTPVDPAGYL